MLSQLDAEQIHNTYLDAEQIRYASVERIHYAFVVCFRQRKMNDLLQFEAFGAGYVLK